MSVKDFNGEVIGVAQAINKASPKDEPFNEHDEKVTNDLWGCNVYFLVLAFLNYEHWKYEEPFG